MTRFSYREQYAKYSRYFSHIKEQYEHKPEIKEGVELLLTFLTISFFIVFAIRPTGNTISELISNINSQKEIRKQLDTKLNNLAQARQNYTQEEKRLFLVDQALPGNPTPELFLRQIEGLAAVHSTALKSFSVGETLLYGKSPKDLPEDAAKKPFVAGIKETGVSLVVNGNFENLMAFLQSLENSRQIFAVQTFSLGTERASSESIILTIAGSIVNYLTDKQ